MKTPFHVLRTARDRFRALLQQQSTPEREWQRLFADCPFIFSLSLPLRIHQDDIHPLARPGRAEPDFLIFPKQARSLSTYGVVELKRPDTKLIRIPRRDVLSLSANVSDAISQAKKYAMEVKGNVLLRSDELLVIGNNLHVFVIAGMSHEIAAKVTSDLLQAQFENLLPGNCRIIPYDTLLSAFESHVPPAVHVLNTFLPLSQATLRRFLQEVEGAYREYKGYVLSDETCKTWTKLENEYCWLLGPDSHYERVISRSEFEIADSDVSERRGFLATEAPNPSMFAQRVCGFLLTVVQKAREFGISTSLPVDFGTLWRGTGAYASD